MSTTSKRIPSQITVYGVDEIQGVSNIDALEFFAGLDLAELRKRQSLCRQQQAWAHEQSNEKATLHLAVTEELLTQAVELVSFEDWVVPTQLAS